MDLVGVDVGFEVSQLVLRAVLRRAALAPVAAGRADGRRGRLGRKTGRGWYDYAGDGPHRPEDPPRARSAGGGDGRLVVIAGDCALARRRWPTRRGEAGWDVADPERRRGEVPALIVDCGGDRGASRRCRAARSVVLCAEAPLAALDPAGSAAGFHAAAAARRARRADAQRRRPRTPPRAPRSASSPRSACHVEWVGDAPGLVLGRIVCQLVNEAASRSARASAPPRTSTPAWCSASTTRAARSRGATRSASTTSSPCSTRSASEYREERYRAAPPAARGADRRAAARRRD